MKFLHQQSRAFSLVEIAVALGVAGFSLIAIFGLLPVGLASNKASIDQTAANGILSSLGADLRATPRTNPKGSSTTSLQYKIPIPANPVASTPATTTLYFTNDGQSTSDLSDPALASRLRYRATITFSPNSTSRTATYTNLKVSWPAQAATPTGSAQTFLALDRN